MKFMHKILDNAQDLQKDMLVWFVGHGFRLLVIVIIFIGLNYLLRFGVDRFIHYYLRGEEDGSEKHKRVHTMSRVLSVIGGVLLLGTGLIMVLAELGIDIVPVLASLGVGGLAIGFGAQSLVKDVITGFFLLFEDQVRVGDVVEAAGRTGSVEKVGLRSLILRDGAGNRIVIPNGTITQIVNMTYEFSRFVFEIGVAYKENVDAVIGVIREIGESLKNDPDIGALISEPMDIAGLVRFADSALIIKGNITTKPGKQGIVGNEFNRRVKKVFDEKGIEMPYPHRKVVVENKNVAVN